MKKYNVRFLKSGLIEFEAHENATIKELQEVAKSAIDSSSDEELYNAMDDCIPSIYNPSKFDADSFQVEAIEDKENDYKNIYMSDLWKEYSGHKDNDYILDEDNLLKDIQNMLEKDGVENPSAEAKKIIDSVIDIMFNAESEYMQNYIQKISIK